MTKLNMYELNLVNGGEEKEEGQWLFTGEERYFWVSPYTVKKRKYINLETDEVKWDW